MTPDKYTNQEFFIEVSNGHELYVQDWGNKNAKKVIFFLHGGPGDGCKDRHKGQFDPTRQRVIFHDQRGSGRSLPKGSLEHNTTKEVIEDISKIADKIGIKTFIITGGSWGSTLALAYSLAHPERVEAMVLDGIFTATRRETEWIDKGRFQTFYPDVWEQFQSTVPKSHHADPAAYHFQRAIEGDEQAQKESGLAYETMEVGVLSLDDRYTLSQLDDYDPSGIRIEIYYLAKSCFLPEGYILENAHKLTMPIYLVQGRYDMVCPPTTAYELHKQLPKSELIFTTSGHKSEREAWNIKRTLLLELTK
jgi:proline iminopeptidase